MIGGESQASRELAPLLKSLASLLLHTVHKRMLFVTRFDSFFRLTFVPRITALGVKFRQRQRQLRQADRLLTHRPPTHVSAACPRKAQCRKEGSRSQPARPLPTPCERKTISAPGATWLP